MCNELTILLDRRPSSMPLQLSSPTSSSNHERVLVLQLFEFFDLLSQKQDPAGGCTRGDKNRDVVRCLTAASGRNFPPGSYSDLCSRNVAWISQTRTSERRFLSSVQFSDMQMLPIVWASSRSLDALIGDNRHLFFFSLFKETDDKVRSKRRVWKKGKIGYRSKEGGLKNNSQDYPPFRSTEWHQRKASATEAQKTEHQMRKYNRQGIMV